MTTHCYEDEKEGILEKKVACLLDKLKSGLLSQKHLPSRFSLVELARKAMQHGISRARSRHERPDLLNPKGPGSFPAVHLGNENAHRFRPKGKAPLSSAS